MLLVAVGAAGGGAALAVASVPDGNGVIHACVEMTGSLPAISTTGNLRIIDSGAGQRCSTAILPGTGFAPEAALDWNTIGPQGLPGTPAPPAPPPPPPKTVTFTIGLTLAAPPINERGNGIGHVTLSGKSSIDFDIFALSLASATTSGTGEGGGAGKVAFHDITVTKVLDKLTTALSLASVSHTQFSRAAIVLDKGGKQFLMYNMQDVLISAVQLGAPKGGGNAPTEQVTLSYGKLKIQYTQQTSPKRHH